MKSFVHVFALIFVPIALVTSGVYWFASQFIATSALDNITNELRNEWQILAASLDADADGKKRFDSNLIRRIATETELRITLIDPDGRVIQDSSVPDERLAALPNHASRPEIRGAQNTGATTSLRYSTTVEREMVYLARALSDGHVLRLSYPSTYIATLQRNLTQQNLLLFGSFFVVTAVLASILARRISVPVSRLEYIAESIEQGSRQVVFPSMSDPTLEKVSRLIRRIYLAMNAQQKSLEEERRRLARIFATIEEGIVLLDEHNQILHFNRKAEEILATNLPNQANVLADLREYEIISFFRKALSGSAGSGWRKIGCRQQVFAVNTQMLDGQKLLVFFDVTESDAYERYKSELVSNISHELRTPLSMIMGYSETLLADPEMKSDMSTRFLRVIYRSSRRLGTLIEDVLKLHKLESDGTQVTVPHPTDVGELVEELRDRYAYFTTEKDVQFEVPENLQVNVRYEHLMSVFSNLIENAIRYSDERLIEVRVHSEGLHLQLDVEDGGPLIPASERRRIFERFYTVSRSRNQAVSGTGIGLAITKNVARLYSGSIRVIEGNRGGNIFRMDITAKAQTEVDEDVSS